MNQQPTTPAPITKRAEINALAGAMLAQLDGNPAAAFEQDIGYAVSFDAYYAALKSILTGWLNRSYVDAFHAEICQPLQWGEWELTLSVDPGRRPEYGRFGLLDAGRPKCLHIRGIGPNGSAAHAAEWDSIDEVMTELLRSVAVTFDQAWFLFGTGWAPTGLYRPAMTVRTLRPGGVGVHRK